MKCVPFANAGPMTAGLLRNVQLLPKMGEHRQRAHIS